MVQENTPSRSESLTKRPGRKGVVAVIFQEKRFLTIRRSAFVTAPNLLCLPGGGIEPGETPRQALIREMQEELGILVTPIAELWQSRTPWGTHLAWWTANLPAGFTLVPAPEEVAEVMWMTADELMARTDILVSVPQFIEALRKGQIQIE